ncbi:MAG: hypothetical protein ACI8Y7_000628 [Candidatus Woesearchaeota archaeon]|jgi:hypothetical protein
MLRRGVFYKEIRTQGLNNSALSLKYMSLLGAPPQNRIPPSLTDAFLDDGDDEKSYFSLLGATRNQNARKDYQRCETF